MIIQDSDLYSDVMTDSSPIFWDQIRRMAVWSPIFVPYLSHYSSNEKDDCFGPIFPGTGCSEHSHYLCLCVTSLIHISHMTHSHACDKTSYSRTTVARQQFSKVSR